MSRGHRFAGCTPHKPLPIARAIPVAILVALTGLGCATKLPVRFEVGPAPVAVFVDGEPLESAEGSAVLLRADRAHVVMLRKPGYHPVQIVIESRSGPDGARLSPDVVEVQLVPIIEHGGSIGIEIEEPPTPAPLSEDPARSED